MKPCHLLFAALSFQASAFLLPPSLPSSRDAVVLSAARTNDAVSSRQQHIGISLRSLSLAGLGTAVVLARDMAPANAKEKPEYLKEPTPEFEAMQKRAMEFEKLALEKKRVWKDKYAVLPEAKTEDELVKALDGLTAFVLAERGLPVGIKKQALVSDIRKVKRAGKEAKIWNKNAEISYEQLIYSINYEQSPNTARDLTAPL
ncbi:hypothetical protein VYU27_001765 [Nannochloropsis oceanica]